MNATTIPYLDNAATTPLDPAVLEVMVRALGEVFGNASSSHRYGALAASDFESARAKIASLMGASAREVVITSGATESNNLALKGLAAASPGRRHIVTQATEHKAVLDCCHRLARDGGHEITVLPVDHAGRIDTGELRSVLRDDTLVVAIMAANNETGVLQPIEEIGAICLERGVPFLTDATQACGKVPLDVAGHNVAMLSGSAHKMYGPKGVGWLFVRRNPRLRIHPLFDGGGQQDGIRPGTLAVPLAMGAGKACELAAERMVEDSKALGRLRDTLENEILATIPDARVNGGRAPRLPSISSISFPDVDGEALLTSVTEIAVSAGSACTSGSGTVSHVLTAIGVEPVLAKATLRFSLGRFNTSRDCGIAADLVCKAVQRLRLNRRGQ